MILHLFHNDKFDEYAIKQFSGEEMCSEFVVVTHSETPNRSDLAECVKKVFWDKKDFKDLLCRLGDYNAIVLHGLFFPWQEIVLQAVPDNVKVAWVFWGGDLYGRKDIGNFYLSNSSKALLLTHNIKRILKGRQIPHNYEIPYNLLQKIDYCLTDISEDFAIAQKYLKTDIKEIWYNYYSVEETIGELAESRCDGSNVLIGNSSTLECNHLDGFLAIKKIGIPPDSKIYVPLSYGDSWIRNAMIKKGRKMFGDGFAPLTEFLPRDKYNEIIKSCSVAIMPHYRPQAFGNILTALWLGTRVFLSERNVLLSFFKRIGTNIFSIENDLSAKMLSPLSDEETDNNRKIISSIYGKEVMHQKNLELVNILNQ